jgi:hypothetical protein
MYNIQIRKDFSPQGSDMLSAQVLQKTTQYIKSSFLISDNITQSMPAFNFPPSFKHRDVKPTDVDLQHLKLKKCKLQDGKKLNILHNLQ